MQKTVQVVIEISEDDYELACKYPEVLFGSYANAIKNGTVLPEHGRLIDADELERNIDKFESILYHTSTILEAWGNEE